MKIAIDCRMSGKSGIGTYLDEILPYFVETAKVGKNSLLLVGNLTKLEKYSNIENVQLCECNIPIFSFKEYFSFPLKIASLINHCDVYYSPYCNIPSKIFIPIYTTIHDVLFLDMPNIAGFWGTFIRKLIYKYACIRSNKIFTVSLFSKQRINYHLRTIKPIIVTYNGVSSCFINKEKNKKDNSILFVGNIKQHKGLQYLIPAFINAKKDGLDAKLYIIGNFNNLRTSNTELFNMIEKSQKDDIVLFENVTKEQLIKLYKSARLLVQPSLYEGFGLPPLEALYSGTNVLLSDISVFKEIYEDFPVTFYEAKNIDDLTTKIIQQYNNPIDITNIPQKYSYEKTARIILDVLEEVL